MAEMQAVRIHEYGGVEVLKLEQAPVPPIGDEDVLIRIHATAINPIEWKIRAGYLQAYLNFPLPWILGLDISGTVVETGAKVTKFAPGDEVIARGELFRSGAYAEYAAVRNDYVTLKPKMLSHQQAAVVPHAAVTAWSALVNAGNVAAGQTVLVHAAAGGVGSFAVQLAKCHGARVIGTASPNHHAYLKGLGVDQVIDYNTTRFEEATGPVDLVLDTVGGDTLERSFSVIKPGGMLLSIVDTPSTELAAQRGIQTKQVAAEMTPGILDQITHLIETNQLQVTVSESFPLREIGKAHTLSAGNHVRGKIGISVID
jgi:NADPH:quinone reductase-like Zn-dependent oxidoreductase